MPIRKLGYAQLFTEIEWMALRPYENWSGELKRLAQRGLYLQRLLSTAGAALRCG
ncbi:MAG TPA: hypothetical protein VLK82_24425 [Candidatus Tectomicrobia bacterium]|nr:hypothetical protein [Candidatus Tectomicrobia bacterium]